MPSTAETPMRFFFTMLLVITLGSTGCEKEADPAAAESSGSTSGSTDGAQNSGESGTKAGTTSGAQDAPAGAGQDCIQAYADLEALIAGLEEQLGPSDAAMPDRDDFIARCQTLPPEVQRCMVFEYGMANKVACEELVDGLDPDQREQAEELMGK